MNIITRAILHNMLVLNEVRLNIPLDIISGQTFFEDGDLIRSKDKVIIGHVIVKRTTELSDEQIKKLFI